MTSEVHCLRPSAIWVSLISPLLLLFLCKAPSLALSVCQLILVVLVWRKENKEKLPK